MRRSIQGLVWAGVLTVGSLTGLGTSSAQAQGFGGYPGTVVGGSYVGSSPYGSNYVGNGSYGRGYNSLGGGLGVGVNVYSNPGFNAYPAYQPSGYGYSHHHHHRHHRGCGHHGY